MSFLSWFKSSFFLGCIDIQYKCVLFISKQGTVIIIANHGDRIDIPSGSVLENKIVSGNLRILDH